MMTDKKKKPSYRAAKEAYGEAKRRYNVTLTQSVVDFLDNKAEELGLSRSELMERIFRSMILEENSINWRSFVDEEENPSDPQNEAGESSSSHFEQTRKNKASLLFQQTPRFIGNLS